MKRIKFIFIWLLITMLNLDGYGQRSDDYYPEEQLSWKIAVQASTFRRFTFLETLDKVRACGLKYVEGFSSQQIGGEIAGTTDYRMDRDTRERIKQALQEKGVRWIAYGVVSPNTVEDWHKLFEFAKEMGIETITSEPKREFLPLLVQLTNQYGIKIAVHNHAAPTMYWSPDTVLATIEGQGEHIGACADIGHWMRSGLQPVKCLNILDGRIASLHMKDLNVIGDLKAHDVPWGHGKANIKKVAKELLRQSFEGVIAVEYEHNRDETWFDSVPAIRESVAYLRSCIK